MMTTLRRALFASVSAAALALSFGSQASAQTIYGGGATLPTIVLRQLFNCYGADIRTAGNPFFPAACTAPVNSPVRFTYATVGSGGGLRSYALRDSLQLGAVSGSNPTPYADNGTPTPSPLVGITYPFPAHHYSSSESPLTPINFPHPTLPGVVINNSLNQTLDCFYGTGPSGCLTDQRIATGAAMVLPFLSTTGNIVANFGGVAKTIKLSRTSLCGIFTGKITNWNAPQITADNGGVSVSGGVARTIQPVVRADSSGTTFITVQALEAMCTPARTASTFHPNGFNYKGGVNTLPDWNNAGGTGTGINFYRASGNNGVAATIADTPWSVGYLSPDFSRPQVTTIQVYAQFNVTNGSGTVIKTLGVGATSTTPIDYPAYTGASLQNAQNIFRMPTAGNAVNAMKTATPPAAGAPRRDPINWYNGALITDPQDVNAYPISGFGWFLNYTCYSNSAVSDALRGYWSWYLDTTSNAKAILTANGFGALPGTFLSAVRSHTLNAASTRISPVSGIVLNTSCNGKLGA